MTLLEGAADAGPFCLEKKKKEGWPGILGDLNLHSDANCYLIVQSCATCVPIPSSQRVFSTRPRKKKGVSAIIGARKRGHAGLPPDRQPAGAVGAEAASPLAQEPSGAEATCRGARGAAKNANVLAFLTFENANMFDEILLKYWGLSGAKACKSCR